MPEFDLAVIGAGAAGLTITAVAAQLGLRVALIERARMGGDCLNSGCVPSKALLASAHAVQAAARAERLGIRPGAAEIDWDAVQRHVQGVIAGILAPHAGEMIGMWTLAIQQRIKLSVMAGLILPYPTRAEAGKRAAGSFFTDQLFAPITRRLVRLLRWLP